MTTARRHPDLLDERNSRFAEPNADGSEDTDNLRGAIVWQKTVKDARPQRLWRRGGQAADDPTRQTFDRGRGKRAQEQGRLAHVYDAREGFQRPWVDIRVAVYQSGEQLLQDLKGILPALSARADRLQETGSRTSSPLPLTA